MLKIINLTVDSAYIDATNHTLCNLVIALSHITIFSFISIITGIFLRCHTDSYLGPMSRVVDPVVTFGMGLLALAASFRAEVGTVS